MTSTGPGGGGARPGRLVRALAEEVPALRRRTAISVAVGLFSTAAIVAQAVGLAHLLASAMPGAVPGDRAGWFICLGTGAAARALAGLAGELNAAAAASQAKAALRRRLVLSTLGRAPLRGEDPRSASTPSASARPAITPSAGPRPAATAGDAAVLAGRGLDALDVYVGRCLPDMVLAAAAPAALLVVVGALDWLSALIMVVVVSLFPVFGALVGRASTALAAQRWAQVEKLGRQIADLFHGLPVLRAFGRAADQRARLAAASAALERSTAKVLRVAFLSALVLDTLGSFSVALVAVPLGLRLLTGNVTLSSALAVLIVAPEVFLPLRRASAEFHESTEGLAAVVSVLAVIGPRPTRPELGRAPAVPPDPGRCPVALRSVTMSVPGRATPVLDGADLVIAPGEIVVLVGPSGAGKSTIVSLFLGFTRPDAGQVTVDGTDLGHYDLDGWRRSVTYLPEHPTLLAASLAANLRLAASDASDAQLLTALAQAGAPDLVAALPAGLATVLGEGGRTVSAGELQRIALARALLRPRPLYLLDEPTVHLDQASEDRVLKSLAQALEGRSALVVSHRRSVERIAHRVVALEAGKLVELSSPALGRGCPPAPGPVRASALQPTSEPVPV